MLHFGRISNGPQDLKVLYTNPNFHQKMNSWPAPFSFADDFHVFGGLWDRNNPVSIYVDGQLLCKTACDSIYDDKTPAGFAHVILNLAIGGSK